MNKFKYLALIPVFCTSMTIPAVALIGRANNVVERSIQRSDVFFDVENKETLQDHIVELEKTIKMLNSIIKDTVNLYKMTQNKKYINLLKLFMPARKMLQLYYSVLSKEYDDILSFAFTLKRMVSYVKYDGLLDEFWEAMINLEVQLSGEDLDYFYLLKDAIEKYEVPGIADCMRALNKYF